jgi:hypothetical protein
MRRAEIGARAAVVLAALLATAAGAPTWVSAPLGLASLANGGQLIASLVPGDDAVERWLAAAGGIAVILILLGIALNYLPGAITPSSYAAGWSAVSAGLLLLVARRKRTVASSTRPLSLPIAISMAMLAAATIAAYEIGLAGVQDQNRHPLLALSSLSFGGNAAEILVSSSNAGGAYELVVAPDGRERSALAQALALRAHGVDSATVRVELPAAQCYWELALRARGGRTAERQLVLWRGTSSVGLERHGAAAPSAGLGGEPPPASCPSASTTAP